MHNTEILILVYEVCCDALVVYMYNAYDWLRSCVFVYMFPTLNVMGHGSHVRWVNGSWVNSNDPLPALVCNRERPWCFTTKIADSVTRLPLTREPETRFHLYVEFLLFFFQRNFLRRLWIDFVELPRVGSSATENVLSIFYYVSLKEIWEQNTVLATFSDGRIKSLRRYSV